MAEYYLIAQLPTLDGIGDSTPIPITEERFLELCDRFLKKKAQSEIRKLSLTPPPSPERSSYALVEAWNEGERNLRFALGQARAAKMKSPLILLKNNYPQSLLRLQTWQ